MPDCKIPEIPFASGVEQNLQRMLAPIKETLDIWAGRIGDPLCRHVTIEDLLDEAITVNIIGGGSGSVAVHASTHVTGGSDIIANAVPAGNAGLMSGADKTNLDTLSDNSIADTLHRHSELVASDGSPDPALSINNNGIISTDGEGIRVNTLGSGDRNAYIVLVGDDTYTDYGLKLVRNGIGPNSSSFIQHRGTGTFSIRTEDAAAISFLTGGNIRLTIASDGNITQGNALYFATDEIRARDSGGLYLRDDSGTLGIFIEDGGNVGFGTPTPDAKLQVVGICKFGEDTTNFTEFESDGTVKFNGTATVWDDVQVNIGNVRTGSSTPTWTAYKGSEILAFDKSQDNKIFFTAQLPHEYKEGSDICFHIHLAYPDSGTGDTRWIFTYSWANIGSDFPTESTVTIDIASPEDTDNHHYAEIAPLISGTGKTMSSVLLCSLTREGTHANDDYDDDAYLVALDFHVEKDTVGSRTEITK